MLEYLSCEFKFIAMLFLFMKFLMPKREIGKSAYLEIRYFCNVYLYIWSVTKSYQIFHLNLENLSLYIFIATVFAKFYFLFLT